MSFLLDILPTDVLILIVNVWLDDCVNDMCALDVAIVNKELRMRYIVAGCFTTNKEGFMKQIRIGSEETLIAVSDWKEKRGLDIKRIFFEEYDEDVLYLPHLGTLFPHLQEIKVDDCTVKLHHILFSSLTHLQKLTLDNCTIVVSKEITSSPSLLTNIEELQIFNMGIIYNNDTQEEESVVSETTQHEIYVWITKCCPKVNVCSIRNFFVSYMTVIQMMQQWPLLKEWNLRVPYFDQSASDDDLDLLNEQVSTMKKVNLESISLDCDECSSDDNAKYLLNILLSCCNLAELRSLVLYIFDWPKEYSQRLLQSIPNMLQMKHLTFKGTNSTIPALVDAALTHCHSLETLQLVGSSHSTKSLMLFQAISTSNHFHLAHLTSLELEDMNVTNESIDILCNSAYAKQLTSVCLKRLCGVSFEAYQQVFTSFNQLQSFELFLYHHSVVADEILQEKDYKQLVSLLDSLFNGTCAFANTLRRLAVDALYVDTSNWRDKQFIEELLVGHVIPHWKFPFPNLRTFNVYLQVGDFPNTDLITKRLLVNCPALHTLFWQVMGIEDIIEITQQQEMIRRMRQQYL